MKRNEWCLNQMQTILEKKWSKKHTPNRKLIWNSYVREKQNSSTDMNFKEEQVHQWIYLKAKSAFFLHRNKNMKSRKKMQTAMQRDKFRKIHSQFIKEKNRLHFCLQNLEKTYFIIQPQIWYWYIFFCDYYKANKYLSIWIKRAIFELFLLIFV